VLAAWSPAYRAGEAGASLLDTADAHHERIGWSYITFLMIGLLLFYVAVPLVAIGLAAATGGVIYLILTLRVVPVKLIVIVAVIGFGMAWAVLKSLFAAPNRKRFGIKKTEAECPRLHATLREVAAKLQTDPVEEVCINPGAAIGVWQEGRGPFGILGVKRRVLTLGLSTLHYLSISELKAILAHEYAHFSHHDTAYGRFIHQVTLSTGQALTNMAVGMGHLNYVNPFFWFFLLYHRAYMMLAAGFSRSREFLADRRAASLYGKDALLSGLVKVSTDGTLFESTIYHNIGSLLDEGKAFVNMYEAFRSFRDEGIRPEEREKMYREILAQKRSLFASHPSFHERVEAVSGFSAIDQTEPASAESLFEDLVAVEQELTGYLTAQVSAARHVQWSANSQSGGWDGRLRTRPTYPEELPDSGNSDSDSQTKAS
jgi:Zn-dependent protease with chaperone function